MVAAADFTLQGNAKLNLFLKYTGRLSSGLFSVNSIMVFCGLSNVLRLSLSDCLEVSFEGSEVYIDHKLNTVVSCANLLSERFLVDLPYRIAVEKNVPVGSGMGGGSADAGAFARFVMESFGIDCPGIAQTLRKVGADVPSCYLNKMCFVSGTGEVVRQLNITVPKASILLVNPGKTLLTQDVYSVYAKSRPSFIEEIDFEDINRMDFYQILELFDNDLYGPVISIFPEISVLLSFLESQKGAVCAKLSGSGATCFAVFDDYHNAKVASENVRDRFPGYWRSITDLI